MYPQMTFAEIRSQEIRSQEIVTIISNTQIETFISRGCCIKIRIAISMCLVQFTDSWILRSRNGKFQVELMGLSSWVLGFWLQNILSLLCCLIYNIFIVRSNWINILCNSVTSFSNNITWVLINNNNNWVFQNKDFLVESGRSAKWKQVYRNPKN